MRLEMSQEMLKVLVVGLDNSGKTSIINTLEQKLARFHALKPTVSFEIRDEFKILGLPIKVWDLGGQKQYRDEYLSKKGFIFGESNLLFFVVDVQDPKRYTQAVDYFEKAVEFLEKIELPLKTVILLHKADPEIKYKPKVQKNISMLKDLFKNLDKEDPRRHFNVKRPFQDLTFSSTSIYDRESLSKTFVNGIFQILPKTQVIQEALNEFMKNSGSQAVVLLDENVLIIGEAFSDETSKNLCEISGPFLSNMSEKLIKYNLNPPLVLEAQMSEDEWLFQKPIQVEDNRFYLAFLTKQRTLEKINKFLPRLTEDLSNLIKYVVSPKIEE